MRLRHCVVTGTALLSLLVGCGQASEATSDGDLPGEGITLRVALYGGTWAESIKSRVGERFTRETGAQVSYVEGNPSDYATQLIASGGVNPPFDVVFTDGITQTDLVEQGLLEKMDYDAVPSARDVKIPPINDGYNPGMALWYIGIAYNTEKFEELGLAAPTTWADLWRPELAGKVALPDVSTAMGLPTIAGAAAIGGGDPYHLAAGVERLTTLETYSIYKSSSQMQTDFANGNIWAAAAADGRAWQLADEGLPVSFVLPTLEGSGKQSWLDRVFVDVVKGTKYPELAKRFQELSSTVEAQVGIAEDTAYSPITEEAIKQLYAKDPEKWEHRWPDPATLEEIATLDYPRVVPVITDVTNLFSRELGGN